MTRAKDILKQIKDWRAQHGSHRAMPFDQIQHNGTVDQLHKSLIELARARRIRLVIWSGALSDVPQPELLLAVGQPGWSEQKYFAELVG